MWAQPTAQQGRRISMCGSAASVKKKPDAGTVCGSVASVKEADACVTWVLINMSCGENACVHTHLYTYKFFLALVILPTPSRRLCLHLAQTHSQPQTVPASGSQPTPSLCLHLAVAPFQYVDCASMWLADFRFSIPPHDPPAVPASGSEGDDNECMQIHHRMLTKMI
jgi:hypothetical protein